MKNIKKVVGYILIPIVFILIGWFANTAYHLPKNSNPIALVKPTPLLKYTIENLSQTSFAASTIQIGDTLKEYPKFTSYKYTMTFSPDMSENLKTVSGVINIPNEGSGFPVIAMFRGYVDPTVYFMGEGTQPSAAVFAEAGYITVAPDFLGYGESDKEAADIFESRFQTYVTAAVTLKSVSNPAFAEATAGKWDGKNIFIWGHSNGGQVALTTLEITGVTYPTVLWAPVSMRFPASILYYVADAVDGGKYLISQLANFEDTYDPEQFSLINYFGKIKAPIQLNQGTSDEAVPFWLSDSLDKELKEATISATYIKYPGNDHNMKPNWNTVVDNNLTFFEENLK
jgi:dipeptidyl aminopeptidase/acylaminoacyl peptidase